MKKQLLIIGITLLLLAVGFSGCDTTKQLTGQTPEQIIIGTWYSDSEGMLTFYTNHSAKIYRGSNSGWVEYEITEDQIFVTYQEKIQVFQYSFTDNNDKIVATNPDGDPAIFKRIDVNEPSILSFEVKPSQIQQGETAFLGWGIIGATSVIIDNGIGNVNLTDYRIVMPTVTTTYTLTASNGKTTKTATTQIIVKNNKNTGGNRIAVIDTTMGTTRVQLYEDKMPITTANFIKLANDGFYAGLIFHRIGENFMIQAGGYFIDGTQKFNQYGNIPFETSDVKHVDGAISMASTGAKVGGSSEFFICDRAQPFLDGNYAAFGVTIEGLDVVRAIAAQPHPDSGDGTGRPTTNIIINSITIIS